MCELTLQTQDPDGLAEFYINVLGLEVLERSPDRVWLACGPRTRLGLWTPGEKEFGDQGGRHVHFAFSVAPDRLGLVAERLSQMGLAHRGPVSHEGGDRSLYFEDPEGNVVELWDFFHHGNGARHGVSALADG